MEVSWNQSNQMIVKEVNVLAKKWRNYGEGRRENCRRKKKNS